MNNYRVYFIFFFACLYVQANCSRFDNVYADYPNVIQNYDMEQGSNGTVLHWKSWCFSGSMDCLFSWDDTEAYSGLRSLKITGSGKSTGSWHTTFDVTPGKLYRISYFYKAKCSQSDCGSARMNSYLSANNKETVLWINTREVRATDWMPVHMGDFIPEHGLNSLTLHLRLYTDQIGRAAVWFDDVTIMEMDPPQPAGQARLLAQNEQYALWAENGSHKVFKGTPAPSTETLIQKIELRAAQGETEPFQVVIRPETQWNDVSWSWSDFSGPAVIPKNALTYHRVAYIHITEPSTIGTPGWHPDPLPIETSSTLLPGENSPFWFLVTAPRIVPAGTYSADLTLKHGSTEIHTFQVNLKVWNFQIPETPSIPIVSSIRMPQVMEYEIGDYKNIFDRLEVAKRYYHNVIEHRAKIGPHTSVPVKVEAGHAVTDTDDLERHVAFLKMLGCCKSLPIPGVLWITDDKETPKQWPKNAIWNDIRIFLNEENTQLNPAFIVPFSDHVRNIMEALKRQGCYERPMVKFFDEPDSSHLPTINAMVTLAALLRAIDPNICASCSGVPTHSLIEAYCRWDFYGKDITFVPKELSIARQKNAAWIYDNSIPIIDLPLLRMRLFQWMLWKERFDGAYSFWNITHWKENPWATSTDIEGSLLYPPISNKEIGPITSLRWEMIRQGLEDYEYLHLLEDLLSQTRAKAPHHVVSAAEEALQRPDDVVFRLPVGGNDQPYSLDVALVEEVRHEIARAIESLIPWLEAEPPTPPTKLRLE